MPTSNLRFVFLLAPLALVAGCKPAGSLPGPTAPPIVCRFAEAPIGIDGTADEAAWAEAVEVSGFSIPWLPGNPPAAAATRAKLLWDREHLYVAADMDDTDLYADVTDHDGLTWDNDVFEVFLKPAVDKPAYYEFQVTAANTQFDCFIPRRGHVNRFRKLHDFGIESAVKLRGTLDAWSDTDKGWTVELKIPWSSFMHTGGRPEPGDEWRVALCRYDHNLAREAPELSTAAPLTAPNFHRHEEYRPLVFEGPRATAAKPFGMPTIVPVTSSRVSGSPDPPLPYRVGPAFPLAKLSCPIAVAHQPGSDRLLTITEPSAYRPSTVIRMRDDPASFEPEVLIPADETTVHYAITFHPKFAENGYVYIGSNGLKSPDGRVPEDDRERTRITRYVIDREPPYAFHPESATVIIEWDSNGHDGGDMAFGADGMMYVGSGDGSSDSDVDRKGQDLTSLRAKILRIDVDRPDEEVPGDGRHYSVPADNPIFDAGSPIASVPNARPETWAYGLRQPWRLSFDPAGERLWVGNQGQDLWEQIYLIQRGANYGWSVLEGTHPFHGDQEPGPTPFSRPVMEHSHSEARSITGGLVYTGTALPQLVGAYIYGDYSTGRIWAMRHDGANLTWHELIADTKLSITGFGTDSKGEILICDHQPDDKGGLYRLVPQSAVAADVTAFPRKLSETGLFADISRHQMVPGAVPFEPAAPQWSDGTHDTRFLVLPPTTNQAGETVPAKISVTNERGWNFPDGTVLVKSLALDGVDGDPATRRWVETQVMLKEQGEWAGYSYEWNDDQTDAVLVDAEGKDREFAIAAETPGGQTRRWRYPSRSECMVCHSRASNYVLGLSTVQLNHDFDYGAVLGAGHASDNQLRTLEHLGLLDVNWWAHGVSMLRGRAVAAGVDPKKQDQLWAWIGRQVGSNDPDKSSYGGRRSSLLPIPPTSMNRLVDPYDPAQPLEARARSYLQANCACCHVPAGGGNAQIDLEYRTTYATRGLDVMKAVGEKPLHASFDLPDARLIAPGAPERSVLFARISRRGPSQMPQLGTDLVDERAVALLREWIESLAPLPKAVSVKSN
jgi:glucose/arabinose dehydrogenase